MAWSYLKKGDINKTVEGFKKVLNTNPNLADPHYGLGIAYYKKGERQTAKDEFLKVVKLLPSYTKTDEFARIVETERWWDVLSELGWSFYHFRQYQDSWDSFNKAISKGVKDANTLRGAGYAALKNNKPDEAINYSMGSLSKDPNLPPVIETVEVPGVAGFTTILSNAQTTLAWGYYNKKDYKQAIKEFTKSIDKNPDWVDPRSGLGWSYYYEKRYDEAEEEFKKVLKLDPSYGDALNGLAAVRYVKFADIQEGWRNYYAGDYEKALQHFKKGLEGLSNKLSSDDRIGVTRGIAWSYYWQKDYANAGKVFREIISKREQDMDALLGLGYIAYQKGDYSNAIPYLKKVTEAIPNHLEGILTLAWSYYRTKDYGNTIVEFKRSIQINPYIAEPYDGLGWSYLKRGDVKRAEEEFKRALSITPNYNNSLKGLKEIKEAK